MMSRPLAIAAILIVSAALCLAPRLLGAYHLSVLFQLLAFIALTQSWATFSGMTGYASLGYAAFYGLGAYVMALGWMVLPLWQLIPLAGLAAGLLALAIGAVALRVRGPYFVILTLGISELVRYVVVAVEAKLGASGRVLFLVPDMPFLYVIMLALAAAATAITWWMGRSRMGAGLHAIREDETAAITIGVPTASIKTIAFALSAIIPGMVGAVWILRSTYFEPAQVFSPAMSFSIITMAVIGGSDKALGPIFGAAFVVLLSELLWARAPQLYMVVLGVLLICFVLFAPDGIYGRLRAAWVRTSR